MSYSRIINAGTGATDEVTGTPGTAAFGVRGVNRNGKGPCEHAMTENWND